MSVITIEPGKVYVIEVPGYWSDRMHTKFRGLFARYGADVIILEGGATIAKEEEYEEDDEILLDFLLRL